MKYIPDNPQWNQLIQIAEKDIETYQKSVNKWLQTCNEHFQVLSLTRLLVDRARSRAAIRLLQNGPDKIADAQKGAIRLWEKAEKALFEKTPFFMDVLGKKIARELSAMLDEAERNLHHIISSRHEFRNGPSGETDFKNSCYDFLQNFNKIASIHDEIKQAPFELLIPSFQVKFFELEQEFRKYFGYFDLIAELLPSIHAREFYADYWWLIQNPENIDNQKENNLNPFNPDELIYLYQKSSLLDHTQSQQACPDPEQIIAFALNETDSFGKAEIETHLLTCTACMELYFDVQISQNHVADNEEAPERIHSELLAAIHGPHKKERPEATTVSAPIIKKTSDFIRFALSFFMAPKNLAMLAACSLAGIIIVYNTMNTSVPIHSEILLTTRQFATRGVSPQDTKPYTINEGGILHTGNDYRVTIHSDKDGYGYAILANDSGRIKLLFKGKIFAGKPLQIPDEKGWERLDPYRGSDGKEMIYFIAVKKEIKDFDQKFHLLMEKGSDQLPESFPKASIQKFSFRHE